MSVRRAERPLIIPVFIPNQGCPHLCIYCRQDKITDQAKIPVNGLHIEKTIDTAIKSRQFAFSKIREVAFYGGTFTKLGIKKMTELLEAVNPYLNKGIVRSIRVSTRPDEIDKERLDLMKNFGVSTVELGVQSMDDEVLRLSQRGHSAADTVAAVKLLKRYGFKVGAQLMPGLPGDSEKNFLKTVSKIVKLQPDMARLYPAIVIDGTELAAWYNANRYRPLTLEDAVRICVKSSIRLESSGIPVIRIGLMSSPSLLREGQIVAGPWHSAFGFLVRSNIHLERIEPFLPKPGVASKIGIRAPDREIPLIRGHKNEGLCLIEKKIRAKIAYIKPDDSIPDGEIAVDVID